MGVLKLATAAARALFGLALLGHASPAFAQSAYLSASIGTETLFLSNLEVFDRKQIDPGTTLTFGARAGLPLGAQWGAEIAFSRGNDVSKDEQAARGLFGPTDVLGAGIFNIGGPSDPSPGYELHIHSSHRDTSIGPAVWLAHPLTNRVDLAFIGGVVFNRMEADERYEVRVLRPNVNFTVSPASLHVVQYRVGALAGIETRLAIGDHVRVTPGVRIHGVGSGWAVRPEVSVGWSF